LRVPTQRRRQPLHDVRPPRRLATREGDRPAYRHRLRLRSEGDLRRLLPARRPDHLASRQPEHPRQVVSLPSLPSTGSSPLVQRFEWVYTPKHGSWLDLAESELAVLSGQCLDRRIPNQQALEREVAAWVKHRNQHHAKADWRFTTETARIKLKHLYPVL